VSAGHRGVESIIGAIGSNNFVRLRVGIGSDKKISTEKFVLNQFEEKEMPALKKAVKKARDAMEYILKNGAEKAASQFNI